MSLAVIYSRGRSGIDAPLVTVEVHIANGLPSLSIVGNIKPIFIFNFINGFFSSILHFA